jgi:hypothetical protein
MTEENESYSSSYNSYSSSGLVVGDLVINNMAGSRNFGTWGTVVSITGSGSEQSVGYTIGNSEYPYQTGWVVYDNVNTLELYDA